jgi:hypothetical protein
MSALQKVNLGTAPAGVDGDAVRTAFIKDNANVDVLNSQTFLTSATLITSAQALTTAHIGKRVNINLGSTGTINLPSASTCAADQVTLLRNLGTTVVTLAITTGSGDTVSISKLNPGESALMDTDGLHAWTCLMRSRTNSDNETVNGNSTVVGNESVGGTLGVVGNTTLGGTLGVTGVATLGGLNATGKLGTTVPTGAIGELIQVVQSTPQTVGTSGVATSIATLSLPPGIYLIWGLATLTGSPSCAPTNLRCCVSPSVAFTSFSTFNLTAAFTTASVNQIQAPPGVVPLTVTTTFNLVVAATFTAGGITAIGIINALRVA